MNQGLTNLRRTSIVGCLLLALSSFGLARASELKGSVKETDVNSKRIHSQIIFSAGMHAHAVAGQPTSARAPLGVKVPPNGYDTSQWKQNYIVDFDPSWGVLNWDVWDEGVERAIYQQLRTLTKLPTTGAFEIIVTNEGAVRATDLDNWSTPPSGELAAAYQSIMNSITNLVGSPVLRFPAGTRRTWQAISFTILATNEDGPAVPLIAPSDGLTALHVSSGDSERSAAAPSATAPVPQ